LASSSGVIDRVQFLGYLLVALVTNQLPNDGPAICVALYSFEVGGSEVLGKTLIRHFLDCGAKVYCVATRRGDGPLKSELEEWGVECLALDLDAQTRFVRLARRRQLSGWLRKRNVFAVHVHHFSVLHDVYNSCRKAGVGRVVVTEHNSDVVLNDPSIRRLVKRYAGRVDVCTAINGAIRDAIVEVADIRPKNIIVIENGVDTEHFCPGSETINDDSVRICWVGRLHPDKDILTGLSAFSRAASISPVPLRLFVAGDGEQMQDAVGYVADADLVAQVDFLGTVVDIAAVYQSCQIFLMSSRTEGTPLALLEALSCGLPIVSTDVGGIRGSVNSETARLVESGDPVGLAAALVDLSTDPGLRQTMGRAARELVLQRFALGIMLHGYQQLVIPERSKP